MMKKARLWGKAFVDDHDNIESVISEKDYFDILRITLHFALTFQVGSQSNPKRPSNLFSAQYGYS